MRYTVARLTDAGLWAQYGRDFSHIVVLYAPDGGMIDWDVARSRQDGKRLGRKMRRTAE